MENYITQTINFLKQHTPSPLTPQLCVVLGSGFYDFTKVIDIKLSIPQNTIPHFKSPQVAGHGKNLDIGFINGKCIAILSGRIHLYEGYTAHEIVYPLRSVLLAYNIKKVILTNAAGGINKKFKTQDLVLIKDHINLTSTNCLIGDTTYFGEKFIDMGNCYTKKWRERLAKKYRLKEGVYAGVLGPNYETPAETNMLRILGADMVGMSTVQEAIAAKQLGADVLGISLIANMACGISKTVSHKEVLDSAKQVTQKICHILTEAIMLSDF